MKTTTLLVTSVAAVMASGAVADRVLSSALFEAQKQAEGLVTEIKSAFADELRERTIELRKRGQELTCTPDKLVTRRE